MSKKLINSPDSVVNDALEGMLYTNSSLSRIGNLNILVRNDIETYKNSYVTLLSGGGSGHEPAHAGFIGEGFDFKSLDDLKNSNLFFYIILKLCCLVLY